MDVRDHFGNFLRWERMNKGLSLKALGGIIGVGEKRVWEFEQMVKPRMRGTTRIALSRFFGVEIEKFDETWRQSRPDTALLAEDVDSPEIGRVLGEVAALVAMGKLTLNQIEVAAAAQARPLAEGFGEVPTATGDEMSQNSRKIAPESVSERPQVGTRKSHRSKRS